MSRATSKDQEKKVKSTKKPTSSEKRVWSIYHFRERFEPPQFREGFEEVGLPWIQEPLGGASDDEGVAYHIQLAMLKAESDLDFCTAYGLFLRLLRLTAQWSGPYRGCLWLRPGEPLSEGQLARILHLDAEILGQYLKAFKRVGLLEYVSLHDFAASHNGSDDKRRESKP